MELSGGEKRFFGKQAKIEEARSTTCHELKYMVRMLTDGEKYEDCIRRAHEK